MSEKEGRGGMRGVDELVTGWVRGHEGSRVVVRMCQWGFQSDYTRVRGCVVVTKAVVLGLTAANVGIRGRGNSAIVLIREAKEALLLLLLLGVVVVEVEEVEA